jgi:2-amino-4-hydroxy-6-hydroxymethyldihydropteridine diphosphokinase
MNTVVIGIGSNIDPENNIRAAIRALEAFSKVIKVSELIRTAPIGIPDQPDFLNGAVKITTSLSKEELNTRLKETEDKLGRDRSLPKFGPRSIDLDIIIWNGKITGSEYYTRDFMRKVVDAVKGEKPSGRASDKKKAASEKKLPQSHENN